MDADLRRLPKAHLHLHLDGAIRQATLAELAAAAGIEVTVPAAYGSFAEFGSTITVAASCLRSPAEVHRVLTELVEDAAAAGAVWVEPSMWPGLFAGRLAASRSADGVVGFGLDGDEAAAPPELFGAAFAVARDAGLLAVPHAGEGAGPESVRAALDELVPDRVMHGVRAADDPGLFGTDLLAEYELARSVLGLSDRRLSDCARTSLEHSAAPRDLVAGALAGIDDWLASAGLYA